MTQTPTQQIDVIATFQPSPGTIDEVVEILAAFAAWVRDNEPGTTRYELVREINKGKKGEEKLVMLERYANKAALKAHLSSTEFKNMSAKTAALGVDSRKVEMKFVKVEGGFASRL